jgi:hypothetical protein
MPQLCLALAPTGDKCDRKKGHTGLHTWQLEAAHPSPAPTAQPPASPGEAGGEET